MKGNRRNFIKKTAIGITGISIVPRHVLGKGFIPPSDNFNLGLIGTGGQARELVKRCSKIENCKIIAASDVHELKLKEFTKMIPEINQDKKINFTTYQNYKYLISRKDIDGVIISSPDHWHAIQSLESMQAGKDVYCEKPLTHTIEEGRIMVNIARKYKRTLQTGSMQRSNQGGKANWRKACEIIRNGYLGKTEKVWVDVGNPSAPCDLPYQPTPKYLDWDRWLGPAPMRSYHDILVEASWFPMWRWYKEFGGGILSDWGAHHFDIIQWALGMDNSGPINFIPPIEPTASRGLKMIYSNGVEVEHKYFMPYTIKFFGSKGSLTINRDFWETDPKYVKNIKLKSSDIKLYNSSDHVRDWLNSIKNGTNPICDVEIGHRTATICHIANLAYELRRPLNWDPLREKFVDDIEANYRRGKVYRKSNEL